MKTTVVPAQVTTVEDRIVGNLSFSQMMFLVIPIFASAAIFAILPPLMGAAVYKYVIIGLVVVACSVLAVRIKGQILAVWFVTILRYNVRPKYYLFNKNVTTLREDYPIRPAKSGQQDALVKNKQPSIRQKLDIPATARVLATLENPAANVRFEATKRGALYVRFTEVEE